jgi:hypothetical protein
MRLFIGLAALAFCACTSAPAPAPEQAVEQFMWDYTKAWNRHDTATIARDFYRTGPSVQEQKANLDRSFDGLRAQGYHHSDIFAVKACMTGVDTAWAGMKFSRLKADGEPLPPKDRASSYTLTKFADGWRITKVGATPIKAEDPLACPAS